MAKTDLKLNATNGYGDDITTTISYVNPDAGKNDILNFTQALNALTTNTYKSTDKITTIEVDNEPNPSTPTLSLSKTTYTLSEFSASTIYATFADVSSAITYNGDGDFVFDKTASAAGFTLLLAPQPQLAVRLGYNTQSPPTLPITIKVGFTETDNFKACSATITITA